MGRERGVVITGRRWETASLLIYLLLHQHSAPVLNELKQSTTRCVLHDDHQALLLHKVVKVGYDVRVLQNREYLHLCMHIHIFKLSKYIPTFRSI